MISDEKGELSPLTKVVTVQPSFSAFGEPLKKRIILKG